jgi:DNA-binding Lrp family transcriptional regulator
MLGTMMVILGAEKGLSIRDIASMAGASVSRCAREVEQLRAAGYVSRRPLVKVERRWDLLLAFSHGWSVRAVPAESFEAVGRPEFLMKAISRAAAKGGLDYAFTMLAGAELLAPDVVPSLVHLYIDRADAPRWRRVLEGIGVHPVEPGATRKVNLLMWDPPVLTGVQTIRGMRVAASHQVFADLYGMGGIFRSAAMTLAGRMGWEKL